MTTEDNLSIDLGPEFMLASKEISPSDSGRSIQTITINNSSDGNATNATLAIYSLTMYKDDQNTTNSSDISKFVENTMIGVMQLGGAKVVKEETVKDSTGENITLYSISEPESRLKSSGEVYRFAIWNIDSRNMVMLLSRLDETATAKIIETLEVKP
jgi:hypothetical protein